MEEKYSTALRSTSPGHADKQAHTLESASFPETVERVDNLGTEDNKSDCFRNAVLRTDKHGMALVPQPSHWKDDPLVQMSSNFAYEPNQLSRIGLLGLNGLFLYKYRSWHCSDPSIVLLSIRQSSYFQMHCMLIA